MSSTEITLIIFVGGSLLLVFFALAAIVFLHLKTQKQVSSERNWYLSLIQSTRVHYERIVDNFSDKLSFRDPLDYKAVREAKKEAVEAVRRDAIPEGTVAPLGPNGEMIADPQTEAALEIMGNHGVSFEQARKWARDGIPQENNSVIGNEVVE